MEETEKPRVYSSIFLDDSWAHQKYFGWKVLKDRPGLRVLRKRVAIFDRYLMLVTTGGEAYLEESVAAVGFNRRLDIVVHDFNNVLSRRPVLAGCAFKPAKQQERLLNIGTYVVDLSREQEDLWKRMGQASRNMVRRAGRLGAEFLKQSIDSSQLDFFYELYEPIARRKKLKIPDRRIIQRMINNGDMLCTGCYTSSGEVGLLNLIYVCKDKAYYMYGAGSHSLTGIGQFMQWNNILFLKKSGYLWYDLGGIPYPDRMDGVHMFKKSIGGEYFDMGIEYKCESKLILFGRCLFNRRWAVAH